MGSICMFMQEVACLKHFYSDLKQYYVIIVTTPTSNCLYLKIGLSAQSIEYINLITHQREKWMYTEICPF